MDELKEIFKDFIEQYKKNDLRTDNKLFDIKSIFYNGEDGETLFQVLDNIITNTQRCPFILLNGKRVNINSIVYYEPFEKDKIKFILNNKLFIIETLDTETARNSRIQNLDDYFLFKNI